MLFSPGAMKDWLVYTGFDLPRLGFGLRTALASCLALLIAWLFRLEHPQWAAMTVWAASQPVRGMLIEKSFFRTIGTLIGSLFGLLLVVGAGDHPLLMVIGIAFWVGLTTWVGNLLHGLIAYGTLLAGYTASMVVLLSRAQSSDILQLGADRTLTALVGVGVALLVGLLFTRDDDDILTDRVRASYSQVLRLLAATVAQHPPETSAHRLLLEIAAIEEGLQSQAGSLRTHQATRTLRALLAAEVSALLWAEHHQHPLRRQDIAALLESTAHHYDSGAPAREIITRLHQAAILASALPELASVLKALADTLKAKQKFAAYGKALTPPLSRNHLLMHRDWVSARQAFIRTFIILLLPGLAWVATGWTIWPYIMLGTSVMISLFSTFENPAFVMANIFLWQCVGAVASLVCNWFVWPLAGNAFCQVLMMMPFIVLGVIPFANRRTMIGAMDYNMIFLLLCQPVWPLTIHYGQSAINALAVVTGPLVAFLAFKTIFPVDSRRRKLRLQQQMLSELQDMALDEQAAAKQRVWRARLNHRVMRLIRQTQLIGDTTDSALTLSLAVLTLGQTIIALRQVSDEPDMPGIHKQRALVTLKRLSEFTHSPEKARRNLRMAANAFRHRPQLHEQLQASLRALSRF
ncbi:FUSC family protein [Entomohabitans teleogrylli]|uniref:FUSC family protein n=1 Tax=Entomohabitans teleogrylli TaxID=1384589 RepID=UPI0020137F87|nr:FUSC family protein [Entomohabitans teleogrylli]